MSKGLLNPALLFYEAKCKKGRRKVKRQKDHEKTMKDKKVIPLLRLNSDALPGDSESFAGSHQFHRAPAQERPLERLLFTLLKPV